MVRCGMGPELRALRLAFVGLALSAVTAQAQDYPNKPIRMIIPYAPGGVVDVSARIVAEKFGNILGQRVVVESRTGASGMLGASVVAKWSTVIRC